MAHIIKNVACPECREVGHDKSGDHAIVFDDGGIFCGKTHFHKSGLRYYSKGEGGYDVSEHAITGEIKYTPAEFRQLEGENKLTDDFVRALALSGMRMKDRYEVMNEEELEAQHSHWQLECDWFDELKTQHLTDRGIHGLIAKMYNVRVGHDESGQIARHYYPRYEDGELRGAKCRTLPKDFSFGNLGRLFGDQDLFGMNTCKRIAETGQRKNFIVVTGGEPDCMAVQQMFVKEMSKIESMAQLTKDIMDNNLIYTVSVNKGEAGVEELIANKDFLNSFKSIIWAFDNDETGQALNRAASKIFRGKSKTLAMPTGTKDPNEALKKGRGSEFVSAIFNAQEAKPSAKIKRVSDVMSKAREMVTMGVKYWMNGFNAITFGIRLYYLSVWGAGTGVGKTDTTMAHVSNLMNLGEDVVVIYLENQVDETFRTFAGMLVGKDFNSPPQEEWELEAGADYNPARDYDQQDLDDALTKLGEQDRLYVVDLKGSKDVGAIMEVLEECFALGYQYFVIDNLTAFEHKDDKGRTATGVQAIDETMKRLGTFKDENPVNIMLLSHLVKVHEGGGRTPHTRGGEVYESDFRGAGSITFWANAVWSIERNTMAESFRNKCVTLYRNLKNRGIGHMVGSTVVAEKDIRTGKYTELEGVHQLPEVGKDKDGDKDQRERNNFDMGGSTPRGERSAPIEESAPTTLPSDELSGDSNEF